MQEEFGSSFLSATDHLSDKMVKWVFIAGVIFGMNAPLAMWKLLDLLRWAFHS